MDTTALGLRSFLSFLALFISHDLSLCLTGERACKMKRASSLHIPSRFNPSAKCARRASVSSRVWISQGDEWERRVREESNVLDLTLSLTWSLVGHVERGSRDTIREEENIWSGSQGTLRNHRDSLESETICLRDYVHCKSRNWQGTNKRADIFSSFGSASGKLIRKMENTFGNCKSSASFVRVLWHPCKERCAVFVQQSNT